MTRMTRGWFMVYDVFDIVLTHIKILMKTLGTKRPRCLFRPMSEGFWSLLGRDNDAEDEAMLRERLMNSFGII